jgi:hypothetical protein
VTPGTAIAPPVLLAVLGGALLHASWNALLKRRGEPLLAAVLVVAGSACVAIVLLPFLPRPRAPAGATSPRRASSRRSITCCSSRPTATVTSATPTR